MCTIIGRKQEIAELTRHESGRAEFIAVYGRRRFGDIYIVCGPLFLKREHAKIGDNQVWVPEAFFKVVLCLTGTPKAFGFIVRNTDGTRKRDLYYNSVDEVERITGLDFFPALPDDVEAAVEAKADIKDWR